MTKILVFYFFSKNSMKIINHLCILLKFEKHVLNAMWYLGNVMALALSLQIRSRK